MGEMSSLFYNTEKEQNTMELVILGTTHKISLNPRDISTDKAVMDMYLSKCQLN